MARSKLQCNTTSSPSSAFGASSSVSSAGDYGSNSSALVFGSFETDIKRLARFSGCPRTMVPYDEEVGVRVYVCFIACVHVCACVYHVFANLYVCVCVRFFYGFS